MYEVFGLKFPGRRNIRREYRLAQELSTSYADPFIILPNLTDPPGRKDLAILTDALRRATVFPNPPQQIYSKA